VQLGGKTATGIQVPDEVIEGLGSGKRPAVSVTVNGFTYRTTIARKGGVFMIPLSAERRQQAGVAAGDDVEVDVELDAAREVSVLRVAGSQPQEGVRDVDRGGRAGRHPPAPGRRHPHQAPGRPEDPLSFQGGPQAPRRILASSMIDSILVTELNGEI
jgi:hypothetical protein